MKVYKKKREIIEDIVTRDDIVLDVGFWGQAVKRDNSDWPHRLLKDSARAVYGVDLDYDETILDRPEQYRKQSAEHFDFNQPTGGFDVIFASELIEHLSNPGQFLDSCARNLKPNGRLILTTPNAFSLFVILKTMFQSKPVTTNPDHTLYFNPAVLKVLLKKNGWRVVSFAYLDTFPSVNSFARWLMYALHRFLALFTPKYMEVLVVVAEKEHE